MKRWTVMLVPHGSGNTRSIEFYSIYLWSLVAVFALLSFTSAFLFQMARVARNDVSRLEQEKRVRDLAAAPAPAQQETSDEARREFEEKVRAEYANRFNMITRDLNELYDLEKRFREINKIPAKNRAPGLSLGSAPAQSGGRGGPPSGGLDVELVGPENILIRPPTVIDGVANPSADLTATEIGIRMESLRQYIEAFLAAGDDSKFNRKPSIWPVERTRRAMITSRFGYRKDPFTRSLSYHDGFDISAPYGSTILATGDGEVIFSGWDRYLGNCVKIDHGGGMVTVYGHMQRTSVKRGDPVKRGDEIGKLGSTGRSTGAHVHYEVRIKGKAVSPEKYLGD
jgi:murein DD-endopeptidase MepM/ murein hydrolase activator NlpD